MTDIIRVPPDDKYNRELIQNVHPEDWINPSPAEKYDLVVIGAGTAGLISALGGAQLGARTALIERRLLGGDCLNFGCVPSKALISASRWIYDCHHVETFGGLSCGIQVDFPGIMERMRRLRTEISIHDSAERLKKEGIDVFLGNAKFAAEDSVLVDGKMLYFSKAVIATGASPFVPPIEGLKESGFVTNETVFSMAKRPEHLLVLGGGPLGCELAQVFRRFHSEVTIVQLEDQFLPREDKDAAGILHEQFVKEGIKIHFGATLSNVKTNDDIKICRIKKDNKEFNVEVDEILVATGRAPNVMDLELEQAGVEYDKKKGIKVDNHLMTTNSSILSCGDVCLNYKFTHVADATARIAIQNALTPLKGKKSDLVIPWCTYTDPEIAHTGLYKHQAEEEGIEIDTYMKPFEEIDRSILESETEGFVKVHVKKGTDRILGATIVGRGAGDMISSLTMAITNGIGLKKIAKTIFPYPTKAEAVRKVTDEYQSSRLSPRIRKVLKWWIKHVD